MQPLLQLAVLHPNNVLVTEVNYLLLNWGYVLNLQTAFNRSVICKHVMANCM